MQTVKFADRYEHITPVKTTVFERGAEETVTDEIAAAARAAGKLEEDNGGQPDPGRAAGGAAAGQVRAKR